MSRLKPRAPFVLVAWTLIVWTGRLQLAWTVTDDSTAAKALATVPVVIFVTVAVVAAIALLRRTGAHAVRGQYFRSVARARRAVGVLVVWTIGYWVVRLPMILVDSHNLPFKAVHTVLALLSWFAAGWVGLRTLRGGGLAPRVDDPSLRNTEAVLDTRR